MADYKLRQTTQLSDIVLLHEKIFPSDVHPDYDDKNIYWLLTCNDRAVGFAILRILDSDIAFLSRAGILSAHRGKGLHKRMIKCREAAAKKRGATKLITYTTKENHRSFATLIKQGYTMYNPEYRYAGNVWYFIK